MTLPHAGKTWASHLRKLHQQDQGINDDNYDEPNDDMQVERNIAIEIMDIVNQRGLPLILDKLTEGKGNCFPIAILHQCKRPEIVDELPIPIKSIVKENTNKGQMQLRTSVKIYIQTSKHPNVEKFKAEYQRTVAQANKEYWDEYWTRMAQNKVWVDYTFIQSTAWYLKHDIMIINTTNNEDNPIMIISGNLDNETVACPGAMLTIGSKSNSHYQSLLPIEHFHLNSLPGPSNRKQEQTSEGNIENTEVEKKPECSKANSKRRLEDEASTFIYKSANTQIEFLISEEGLAKCYLCRKQFKGLVKHLHMTNCKRDIELDDLKAQYNIFNSEAAKRSQRLRSKKLRDARAEHCKEELNQSERDRQAKSRQNRNPEGRKESQVKWQAKSRLVKSEKDPEGLKESEVKRQAKARILKSEKDPEGKKESQVKWQAKSRMVKSEKDPEGLKESEGKRQAKSRIVKSEKDPEGKKESQVKWQTKSRLSRKRKPQEIIQEKVKARKLATSRDRLLRFRQATIYNAIFICTCCHQRHFITNVGELTQDLRNKINTKKFGLLEECIQNEGQTTIIYGQPFNGRPTEFLCLTCKRHLIRGKMPPMAAMNNLQITPVTDPLLQLTELEGALIAKHLIFEKIIQLPKSRWTALKDKIVNIPINDGDILNTIEQLPRTPKDAGLIGVELKRKKEYSNTHKKQLINPEKLYKMLDRLKQSGNPYYQFYDDYQSYQDKCQRQDPNGHDIIFLPDANDDEINEKLEKAEYSNVRDNLENDTKDQGDSDDDDDLKMEEKQEIEYMTKDAVKKWHFDYNKSLCLSDKYPEIAANSDESIPIISVAPGEGKVPIGIMKEKDWDIKAFPHLHNPDGKNGKDHERSVKITDQYYFIQRICNQDARFAKSPAYVYAAVAFLEKKQLQRNINISYTHGKQIKDKDGNTELDLDDGYAVLQDISGTPKYWKKYKYELLAKLDNLGPFQLFFTLSCADMRWDENFAAILREKGYTVHYHLIPDGEDFKTTIEIEMGDKKQRKPLASFLEEDADDSLHEFIRNNVLLATRYFSHRVKAFMREVMMGENNPLNINYYTYKVEFQDRGAGHIHGTLWLKLKTLERLIRSPEGELLDPGPKNSEKQNEKEPEEKQNQNRPFANLTRAFKKIRHEEVLDKDDKVALRNFVDQYTTCSLNPATVGADVAKIAFEVNRHHHTKTCKKYLQQLQEQKICRFGYKKYPSTQTIIVEPSKCSGEEREKKFKKWTEALAKVKEVVENDDIIKGIMDKYSKSDESKDEYKENRKKRILELLEIAGVTLADYEQALTYSRAGYSVVLARDIDETEVNSYNIEMLRAWNGNMDIQICLDFFAVITYIAEYIAKMDGALMEVMKSVLEKNADLSNKDKMALVANTFQTHRQIGESEAFYKLIPTLNLKNSNVTTQWLSLGNQDEVTKRLKLATDEDIASGIPLITLKDMDGFFYALPDMMSKYMRRDPTIEDITSSHFAKIFLSGKPETKRESLHSAEHDLSMEDTDYDAGIDEDDEEARFHYFISPLTISMPIKQRIPLPKVIQLQFNYPKEPKFMRKRGFPSVLRFHKINKNNNPDKYMLHELMLYKPFRSISELMINTLQQYEDRDPETGRRKVDLVKEQVMEHLESIEEARYYVDEANLNIDMERMGILMDPTAQQDNNECQDEGLEEHPEYLHIDPDDLQIQEDASMSASRHGYRSFEISDENDLKKRSRELDDDQRIILDRAIKYAKDLVKARRDGNKRPSPPIIMGHGGAGAGKSTVINVAQEWCQLILSQSGDDIDCPYIIKAAFTGTAAANIQGQTLHSAFGFSFDNSHSSMSDKMRDYRRNALKNLKFIIIDEISMVKADMFYMLDLRLQEITQKINIPFGGLALLCFGDIMQLKPILGRYTFERPANPDFHITHLLQSRWHLLDVLNLRTNHRQGNDKTYADLLNRIRTGDQTEEDIDQLQARVRSKDHPDLTEVELFICCTRLKVAKHNESYLKALPGETMVLNATNHLATQKQFKPTIHAEGTIGNSSFMNKLKLKLGAKVILIHNINTEDCLTNGQLGTLIGVLTTADNHIDKLVVKFNNENAGKNTRKKYPGISAKFPGGTVIERTSFKYSLSKKRETAAQAVLIQFPLKLARAITTHKIQGGTIHKPAKVALDIESCFDAAMAYVMLSRVQEIEQIYILEKLTPNKIRPNQKALAELHAMNARSINNNPSPWSSRKSDTMKIASLNIARLAPHMIDLRADNKMQNADIIHLQETWNNDSENEQHFLAEYNAHFINIGPGKGLATYYKNSFKHEADIRTEAIQITKFSSEYVDSINIYRTQKGVTTELNNLLSSLISPDRITVVSGDFNICSRINWNNRTSTYLKSINFQQYQLGPTQISGGHIDHLYINDDGPRSIKVDTERYSPYYSDHDAILITLSPED